jgi:tRNA(Glu) U13 pseudouridine synthase TruD
MQRAVGEAAGAAYNEAYKQALAQRETDLNRFYDAALKNANFNEAALNRVKEGTSSYQNNLLTALNALLTTGKEQQGTAQSELDKVYSEFLRGETQPATLLSALATALGKLPYGETTTSSGTTATTGTSETSGTQETVGTTEQEGTTHTTGSSTTKKPDNSGWGALGSLFGSSI